MWQNCFNSKFSPIIYIFFPFIVVAEVIRDNAYEGLAGQGRPIIEVVIDNEIPVNRSRCSGREGILANTK